MIRVCDAIMGTGKSSAAITYMNEHKDEKFVYITPYLDEAARIKEGCPELNFIEPSDKIEEYHFTKREHTAALIAEGRNVATTHQSFKMYSDETLADIRRQGYTLIIDENMDVLKRYDCSNEDIRIAVAQGYVSEDDGVYSLARDDYTGLVFSELFSFMRNRDLIRLEEPGKDGRMEHLFYWVLPADLITSFKDTFILTYLFEGQSLYHFLKIYDLDYEYIGIELREDGTYAFGEAPGYIPEYVSRLDEMIHIVDKSKLNEIGDDKFALSMSWYENNEEGVAQLKANVYNCINNIWRDAPAERKLCGAFNKYNNKIKGKGYTKSFLTFNARATNAYRNREYLTYLVNIFMNVSERRFYEKYGAIVDEEKYALSIMVQWIWRSAIRDGVEIYIYIPSRRMRELLISWIETTSEGGTNAIGPQKM